MCIFDRRFLVRLVAARAQAASKGVEEAVVLADASSAGGRAASDVVTAGLLVHAGLLYCRKAGVSL